MCFDVKSVPQGVRDAWCCRPCLSPPPVHFTGSLGSGGLVRHVHDLHAAVGFSHRCIRILELALAVADGHEVTAGDAEFVGKVALDRIYRDRLVEFASLACGLAGVVAYAAGDPLP